MADDHYSVPSEQLQKNETLTCTEVAIKGSFEEDQTTLPIFSDFALEETCNKGS